MQNADSDSDDVEMDYGFADIDSSSGASAIPRHIILALACPAATDVPYAKYDSQLAMHAQSCR